MDGDRFRNGEHAASVEAARLAAVRRYGILDTPPDGAFDRVARLAARLFATPIATVAIVDEQRIWFKALDHRVMTEQAKGILMAREGLDERAAFERLRGYARSTRQPLEPVAAELIKGQPLPAPVPSRKPKRRRQRSH